MSQLTAQPGKIAILGLGKEGIDLLRFLNKLKVKPAVLDAKAIAPTDSRFKDVKHWAGEVTAGPDYLGHLTDFDLIFRSPGVPLDLSAIKRAKRKGVVFSSLTQLFFDLCPAKIVGITGTKGKSTATALTYHLLKGRLAGKVYFGGNIGYPPLSLLPKLTKQDVVVLELSSFQLEDLTKSPAIAVVLNIVPEHLNRHKTLAKYIDAKLNILRHQTKQDLVVIGAGHKITSLVVKSAKGKVIKYSTQKILARGVYVAGHEIIYRDATLGRRHLVMDLNDIALTGQHNVENALAAITVALLLGVKLDKIRERSKSFVALEHRLEPIGQKNGVKFINDSMATTPVATMAAVRTVSGQMSLILGGSSKRENFKDLINLLSNQSIQGVVLIGDTADKLYKLLKTTRVKFPFVKVKDFSTAVDRAYRYAKPQGTVLFSPACASFGWFKDAYDRGDQFKQLVKRIIHAS